MKHRQTATHGIAAIGSMTAAIKAQRALNAAGCHSEIVALSPSQTRRGCAFGIEYPKEIEGTVRRALRAAGIPVSEYLERNGNSLDLSG